MVKVRQPVALFYLLENKEDKSVSCSVTEPIEVPEPIRQSP